MGAMESDDKETGKTIHTIPATLTRFTAMPLDAPRRRKVAGYARVSTDRDEQFGSYAAQIDYYTKYIQSHPDWEFVGVYTDEGVTGTSTKHREGFKSMVADALEGRIDLIVTKSVSRFARNTVDSLSTIRTLKEHGVECYFEKENIWTFDGKGELLITIMSSIAQEESRSISENITWGRRKRFADGEVSVPFGHFLGYDRGPDGGLVVNADEARTVREIYVLFLQGDSPYKIAKRLTSEGIPTPAGKTTWAQDTVRSILTNEKYKGDALLQKTYTEDYLTKRRRVNNGEVQQYYVEHDHEAIIDPAVFDRVQREMERRHARGTRGGGTRDFSGLVVCGECGGVFLSRTWHSTTKYRKHVWQCGGPRTGRGAAGGKPCGTPYLSDAELQTAFLRAANKLLLARRALRRAGGATGPHGAAGCTAGGGDGLEAGDAAGAGTAAARHATGSGTNGEAGGAANNGGADYEARYAMAAEGVDLLEAAAGPNGLITRYDPALPRVTVDHITVYARDDIRVAMLTGAEIRA